MNTNQVARFDQAAFDAAVASFGPANVCVEGKTMSEKRIHVVQNGSEATKMFAATMKGKVGAEARMGLREGAMERMAVAAATGNYKPLAEMLALISGEAVFIKNRASYETLEDRYDAKISDLVASGKYYKKGDVEKLSTKGEQVNNCLQTIRFCREAVEAIRAHNTEEAFDEFTKGE